MELNKIYNCDNLEGFGKIDNDSVDLIVTSPPYDGIRDYKGYSTNISQVGKESFRTLKDGGVLAMVINDGTKDFGKSLTTYRTILDYCDNHGFKLFENIIYSRFGRLGAWWNKRFRVDHEYILIFVKGAKPKTFNKEPLKIPAIHAGAKWHGTQRLTNGALVPISERVQANTKCRGTIWKYEASKSEGNKIKNLHPAPFPDALAKDLIVCFSQENDIVFDPFVGSGTTIIEAIKATRYGIGIEINLDYLEIIKDRINKETDRPLR